MLGGIPTPSDFAGDMATTFFGGVRSYDAKSVQIIIGAIPLIGLAPESFVRISRDKPTFTKKSGVNGEVTRVMAKDLTGTMTIDLMQTSESNALLTTLQYIDELGKFGIVPILVLDISGGSTGLSLSAWIQKPADIEFKKGLMVRRWTFDLATVDLLNLGNVILGF